MRVRAFTVVEVLVAVGVLLVLTAFTVPTYQLILSQLQLNAAVEQVVDTVRLASQRTVTEQQVHGVTITANSTTVPLFRVQPDNSQVVLQTLTLPTNMRIGTVSLSGNSQVRFSAAGAPSVSGSFTVRDTIRNKSRTIEIRPSGSIRANTAEQ